MQIRLFEAPEAEALATVFEAMQAHYRVPCPPRADIVASLRDLPPGNRIMLALAGEILGFAAFASIFPGPGLRKGFFLKELYVQAAHRRRGVGRVLIDAVAALALREGCGRIDWTADARDAALLDFYRSLGAAAPGDKIFFRLDGEALRAAAARR